ncbi:MAG: hypothetical protein GWN94_00185 [Phycisphaerae bacterium]|nr:hypothetical protein [Phycisphaerae bacterium]
MLSRDREDGLTTRSAGACAACLATVPRYRGIGSEAYLNGTSQGPTPEDARKDGHIIRARSAPLSPASGFPVSWLQQIIHATSRLQHPDIKVPSSNARIQKPQFNDRE